MAKGKWFLSENDGLMMGLTATEIKDISDGRQTGLLVKNLPEGFEGGRIYIYCKAGKSPKLYLYPSTDKPGKYETTFEKRAGQPPLNGTVVGYVFVPNWRDVTWLAGEQSWNIKATEMVSLQLGGKSRSEINSYINKKFPKKAMVWFLALYPLRPFVERCTLKEDIILFDKNAPLSSQYCQPVGVPSPWMHFSTKHSYLPDTYQGRNHSESKSVEGSAICDKAKSMTLGDIFVQKFHKILGR